MRSPLDSYPNAVPLASIQAGVPLTGAAFVDGLNYYVPRRVYTDPAGVEMYVLDKRTVSFANIVNDEILFINAMLADNAYTDPLSAVPAGPTAPVVDDTANTIDWTLAATTAFADYEFSLNGGASWQQVTAKPQPIGTGAYAIGQVKVRLKAAGLVPASAPVSNATAYT